MSNPQMLPSTAIAIPTADVVAPASTVGPIVHQSFPVLLPQEDVNEIMMGVRGRVLRRTRVQLTKLTEASFQWPEVLLGLATLLLGGSLGALSSNLPWAIIDNGVANPNPMAILFYVILPILGVAAAVGYFALRHIQSRKTADIAQGILDDLPEPPKPTTPHNRDIT